MKHDVSFILSKKSQPNTYLEDTSLLDVTSRIQEAISNTSTDGIQLLLNDTPLLDPPPPPLIPNYELILSGTDLPGILN